MEKRSGQCVEIVDYFSKNYTDLPVFLGGDFNEEPQNEPIHSVMESAFLDLHYYQLHRAGGLNEDQSANHQPLTTFKYREDSGYVKRTIDYMFVADNNFL